MNVFEIDDEIYVIDAICQTCPNKEEINSRTGMKKIIRCNIRGHARQFEYKVKIILKKVYPQEKIMREFINIRDVIFSRLDERLILLEIKSLISKSNPNNQQKEIIDISEFIVYDNKFNEIMKIENVDRLICACKIKDNILLFDQGQRSVHYTSSERYIKTLYYDVNNKIVIGSGKFYEWFGEYLWEYDKETNNLIWRRIIKKNEIQPTGNECMICFEEMKVFEIMLSCGHYKIHEKCLKDTCDPEICPYCKQTIKDIVKMKG